MDLTKLLQMIVNTLLRRLISRGIDAGINKVSGSAKKPAQDLTPEEREQAKAARDLAKRARQAAKLTRRL